MRQFPHRSSQSRALGSRSVIQEIDFPMMGGKRILTAGLLHSWAAIRKPRCNNARKNPIAGHTPGIREWVYLVSPIWSSALFLFVANEIVIDARRVEILNFDSRSGHVSVSDSEATGQGVLTLGMEVVTGRQIAGTIWAASGGRRRLDWIWMKGWCWRFI